MNKRGYCPMHWSVRLFTANDLMQEHEIFERRLYKQERIREEARRAFKRCKRKWKLQKLRKKLRVP